MARTRGGGVISSIPSRPRRNIGKPRAPDVGAAQSAFAPPAVSEPTDLESGKTAIARSRGGRRMSERRAATPSIVPPPMPIAPERGRKILRKTTQIFTGGSNSRIEARVPKLEEVAHEQDRSLSELLESVDGDSHATCGNDASIPPVKTSPQRESSPILGRSSPSSPKSEVWRMLYVDPDVADPKLVAGRLEVAASMVLRSGCVFDVATDIVQALADVRGDTMSLYRAVFINETLQRHRKSAQSIEGKNLAQFFRQAGMSAARIVLLVAGDVQFDTADAGAHGLSAVLRKPFTRDGFCDVLRGMYLSGDPTIEEVCTAPEELGQPPQPAPPPKERSPCLACGSTPSSCVPHQPVYPSVNRLPLASNMKVTMDHSTGSAAAAAIAAAARAATVRPGAGVLTPPPPSFPDCLGFTPFPPAMIEQLRRYPMVARFSCPGTAPRRKYTKIAPREEEESATPKASSETASSHSSSTKPETPATSGLAGDKIQQGLSPLLAGAADSEVRSDSSGAGCDHPREALEASEDS